MRKNQKYTKEEMYRAIESWQGSGLSQRRFCKQEGLPLPAFGYWLRKYRNEPQTPRAGRPRETFIPVKVPLPAPTGHPLLPTDRIEVCFPNGVSMSCPAGIDTAQLKTLIKY